VALGAGPAISQGWIEMTYNWYTKETARVLKNIFTKYKTEESFMQKAKCR
jgi:hypothetical protein